MMDWFFRPILSAISQLKEQMMADLAAVKAALDQLTTDVAAEKQQVTADSVLTQIQAADTAVQAIQP